MAIYKSSFNNKKPDKEKKEKPVKPKKEKEKEVRPKQHIKVNVPLICLIAFVLLFVVCLPPNFIKSFILGTFGLIVYPICIIGATFSILFLYKKIYI